jgi:hypothetical protein
MRILEPISIMYKTDDTKASKFGKILGQYKHKEINNSPMTFVAKRFYPNFDLGVVENGEVLIEPGKYNIFEACNFILQRIEDNLFNYNTDGLIFTPTLLGVCGNKISEAGPLRKTTWDYSFKWKPPKFNTIDFLISTKKGADGQDIITPIFEKGENVHQSKQFNEYKTLMLQVGFDEKRHGYINPCQDILDDKIPEASSADENTYRKQQFYPSNPSDPQAGICYVMLEPDDNGMSQMFTEEREVFENDTIVEFKYDMNKDGFWRWVPLRVRYDKTADLRNGKISCNSYDTANDNWNSIHNPVKKK